MITDNPTRPRILFIGEGVTLAHVVRPLVLAKALQGPFDLHFGAAERWRRLVQAEFSGGFHPIHSQSSEAFLAAVEGCRRTYHKRTLVAYVNEELTLLDKLRPQVVVGDFRWSLPVSSAICRVPYVSLLNAYWSPYARRGPLPLPTRFTRVPGIQRIWPLLESCALRWHLEPINAMRAYFGLQPCASFFDALSSGDAVAYVDTPLLAPTERLPAHHQYIGPLLWSPPQMLPPWWRSLPEHAPSAYVTMGSSGDPAHLVTILRVLEQLQIPAMVATAGRRQGSSAAPAVFSAELLPGDACAERAEFVICNGGSPTVYQALSKGRPVIGIVGNNVDQLIVMTSLAAWGAGILLRSSEITERRLNAAVAEIRGNPSYRTAAGRLQSEFRAYDPPRLFAALLGKLMGVRADLTGCDAQLTAGSGN